MWRFFLIILFCAATGSSASANPDLRALMEAGQYAEARVQAESLQTAEGFAIAAEVINGQILLGEVSDLNGSAKTARKLAEKSLAIEPSNYNARLQQALADGFVTRTTGTLTAWRKKLPAKTYDMVSRLHADFPEDPRSGALLGAWHLGVIRKVGEKNGAKWFGASLKEGRLLYRAALAKNPNDMIMQANYFMSLHALAADEYDPEVVRRDLEDILIIPPRNDAEEKIKARLYKVYAATNDADAVKKLSEKFLDGEPF